MSLASNGTSSASQLMDPEVRAEQIALRATEARKAGRVRKEYKFRNGVDLPLISFPIDALIYRLENYRTRDRQLSLTAQGRVGPDFFILYAGKIVLSRASNTSAIASTTKTCALNDRLAEP